MTVLGFGAIFNQILPAILHSFKKSAKKSFGASGDDPGNDSCGGSS